jgi:phosphate acyltransferase
MRIALDAMGGDFGPKNNVEGAVLALKDYRYIEKLFLVGNAMAIGTELKRVGYEDPRLEIFHASEVVDMHESPFARKRTAPFPEPLIWSKAVPLKRWFQRVIPAPP